MKLIELLLTKGPNAYNTFREALLQNQSYLLDLLDKTQLTDSTQQLDSTGGIFSTLHEYQYCKVFPIVEK